MIYISDIFINLHNDYFEFYEWNKNDHIEHIKKIPILKISNKALYNIIYNTISIKTCFLNNFINKCEKYHNSNNYNYIALTNGFKAVVVSFNTKGYILKKSSLIFEDEDNICILSKKVKKTNIQYNIIKKETSNSLTRNQKENKTKILKNIKNISHNCLKYLYYDCFNKEESNIEIIIESISNELKNNNIDVMNKSNSLLNLIYQQNK